MTKYTVTGMSCAACAARVEQAAKAVPGAENCAVNLLTGVLSMEGSADPAAVIAAVTAAGYGASLQGEKAAATPKAEESADRAILRRLILSIAILLPLLYLTMGSMLGAPLPAALKKPLVSGIVQLLLAGAVLVINRKFFISGVRGVLRGAPNMDTLVALGAGTAYLYSTVTLLRTAADPAIDDALYFESAAMILTLITVGKLLESRAKGKTTSALRALADRMPKTAIVERDGAELTVPAESLRPGDVFLLRPGSAVPVDGKVVEGSSAIDESALTGESIPMEKSAGDKVHAGTVNVGGFLRCEATAVGEDTTLAEILRLVEDASATKAPVARTADRVAAVFVPAVLFIAAITCGGWLLAGRSVGFALARAISVLVISCPCALGLATPVAIMVGSGVGAKNGLLFKTAAALEQAGRVKTVVFDKTGTITKGKPAVTDIRPASGVGERELLTAAAILEKGSEHPLAAAILAAAEARGMEIPTPADFVSAPGGGVSAAYDGAALKGGNASYLGTLPEEALAAGATLSAEGKTPLYFTKNGEYLGCIAVADELRESAPAAAEALRKLGVRTVLLTGDTEPTARAVAGRCGISDVRAGVLPAGKAAVLTELKKAGKTAMVGDGVNDAPALTVADLGIAIGAGTDVAIDAADTVLTASDPMGVAAALRLGRSTLRNIRENLFWAFFYNVICIPLAAGITGWEMSPMLAAAAMSISSFCVVMNALRLNLVKLYPQKEKMKMETVELKIEGMMCPHCEARVKAALEAIPGVKSAAPSHEKNNAVVTLESSVPAETLAAAVTAVGYKVL